MDRRRIICLLSLTPTKNRSPKQHNYFQEGCLRAITLRQNGGLLQSTRTSRAAVRGTAINEPTTQAVVRCSKPFTGIMMTYNQVHAQESALAEHIFRPGRHNPTMNERHLVFLRHESFLPTSLATQQNCQSTFRLDDRARSSTRDPAPGGKSHPRRATGKPLLRMG